MSVFVAVQSLAIFVFSSTVGFNMVIFFHTRANILKLSTKDHPNCTRPSWSVAM